MVSNPIVVWDLPTRLFHWTLVVLIVLQYASGEFDLLSMEWHYRLGYATLALIVFRVLWGFFGCKHQPVHRIRAWAGRSRALRDRERCAAGIRLRRVTIRSAAGRWC